MEAKYIVILVLGSIFLVLLIIYIARFIEHTNDKFHAERARQIYYSSKNLSKMEYDIASPGNESAAGQADEKQVTMDEVINDNERRDTDFEMSIFSVTEFEGSKEIIGHYDPDLSD